MLSKWPSKIILIGDLLMKRTLNMRIGTNHGSVEKLILQILTFHSLVAVRVDYGLDLPKIHLLATDFKD
jgi:4-hydroxy-3-methylbut-2-en-1-yl diphosphate synthase IspG/GcpE